MSAVPSAEFVRVPDRGNTGHISMPPVSRARRPRCATRGPAAAARVAIGRIHALMREHGITLAELGAALQQECEVSITRCPSLDHDPRYQLPPGARVLGPFTAKWNRLRGGGR